MNSIALKPVALRTLAILPLLVLGSCVRGGTRGFIADRSLLEPGLDRTSQVTVVRVSQFAGGGVRLRLELDGTDIARLGSGDYVQFYVSPGEHFLLMDTDGHINRQLQRFDAKANEPVYFKFEIFVWDGARQWHFDRLTVDEGKKELASGDYDSIVEAPPKKPVEP
jgi:hypothetical protein